MKSKAHSKKCVDLGISVGLIDEQDTEESGKLSPVLFRILLHLHIPFPAPLDTAQFPLQWFVLIIIYLCERLLISVFIDCFLPTSPVLLWKS